MNLRQYKTNMLIGLFKHELGSRFRFQRYSIRFPLAMTTATDNLY